MMPTIHDGDFILMTGITSHKQVHRFDIVEVRSAALKEDIIKRVIGLQEKKSAIRMIIYILMVNL